MRIWLDDRLIQNVVFDCPAYSAVFPVESTTGTHHIKIERYGKNDQNIVFENNQILKDQTIILDTIHVDDILLPNTIKWRGTFYYDDKILPQVLTWGPNGHWLFEFHTPILTWIIDTLNFDSKSPDIIVPGPKNLSDLKQKVKVFVDSWQKL